jgi:hypothetical protein
MSHESCPSILNTIRINSNHCIITANPSYKKAIISLKIINQKVTDLKADRIKGNKLLLKDKLI